MTPLSCDRDEDKEKTLSLRGTPAMICKQGDSKGFKINDVIEIKDDYSGSSADLLFFTACMIYGLEMAEKGLGPELKNCSGTPCMCVPFSSWVAHVREKGGDQQVQRGLFTNMSPHGLRWATVITCLLAILLAI